MIGRKRDRAFLASCTVEMPYVSLTASTIVRPEKPGHIAAPNCSHAPAPRKTGRHRNGGTNKVSPQLSGTNRQSFNKSESCPREKGRPWPNGVLSARAHKPRRFGAMISNRPPVQAPAKTLGIIRAVRAPSPGRVLPISG